MAVELWWLIAGTAALLLAVYFVFASFAFGAGYQPAPRGVVRTMLDFAEVGPGDTLFDLGAGTGAIVFRAARERGARAIAVEVEPLRVLWMRLRRRFGRNPERIEVRWGNLFQQPLSGATVVAVFLWPEAMRRLQPILERELRPGARVVSHWHPLPDWTAERVDEKRRVYLYRWNGARTA